MSDRQQRRKSNARSRQIRQQTIGSHVQRESLRAKRTKVRFGDQRRQARALHGEISHVIPRTSTRESAADFSRRSHIRDHAKAERRKRKRNRAILAIAVAAIAALLVFGVASFVYGHSVDSKMALNDGDAIAQLAEAKNETDPYWVLFAGEYDAPGVAYDGPHLLELMRVDPASAQVTFVWVPPNALVSLSDGKNHHLSEAQTVGGDAELIKAVQDFAGVKIAHYAKVDEDGFVSLVDALGGVTVTLPEEIDDPRAGTAYMPAGERSLDGKGALEAVRATNYATPEATQSAVQAGVAQSLLRKLLDTGGLGSAATFDAIAGYFKTDLTYAGISSLLAPFGKAEGITVRSTFIPGALTTDQGVQYYRVSSSKLSALMDAVSSGGELDTAAAVPDVDASKVSVTVRNGSSIVGAAGAAASTLSSVGYQVGEPSNTETAVYTETLIIYRSSDEKDAAEAVAAALGQGRVSNAGTYYSFDTDVLVVIGSDWISS